MATRYRGIPSIERLLSDQRIRGLIDDYSRGPVVDLTRRYLGEIREEIAGGKEPPPFDDLVEGVIARATLLWKTWPTPLINATGVVIHTNLGRAPLSHEVVEAVLHAARGYTNLEMDLDDGKRGSRQAHIEPILCQLTGAEAALVVSNNASAVLLGLTAIAHQKEVIISRGEAVEIGGGFRIPDVMRQSGVALVEVGTTNRTYLADYEGAVSQNTAALLKVHTSNFRVTGFTYEPSLEEMVELGARRQVPVLHDLGSGCLLETTQFGLAHEPMVQESIAAGVDLAFFSGDKLLGGPQAGVVVGKREAVSFLARHPLARAVRVDKLSMAALSATLLHYLKGQALEKIPVWRMISATSQELEARARAWEKHVGARAEVLPGLSTVGGGSLPGETISTWLLALQPDGVSEGPQGLARRLREADPPVIARIEEDKVIIDPRTVLPEEEDALIRALKASLAE